MAAFARVLQLVAKYGQRAVDWVWANKQRILDWINAGQAIDWIVAQVKKALGIK
ncbi:MAG: aureocin A53 family class IId bacteriocin [Rhodococcus sp. (in: high G+C Gram-positive bacteria)]